MNHAERRDAVLEMDGVEKTWRSTDRSFTLQIDGFAVRAGEVVAIAGESGSGKSTLLELAGLVSRPDAAGTFRLGGRGGAVDVAALHAGRSANVLASLRACRIGFVLQVGGLLPFLTVDANIALAQRLAGAEHDEHTADAREELLLRLGISEHRRAYPAALSVGQRQRVAIARALIHRPMLVLADEPTAALDPPNKARVIELFLETAATVGASVVIATHERTLFRDRPVRLIEITARATPGSSGERVRAVLQPVDAA